MRIMKLPKVKNDTGLGRSTIYQYIANGTFPRPVPLGGGRVGWLEEEIQAWISERVKERDAVSQ